MHVFVVAMFITIIFKMTVLKNFPSGECHVTQPAAISVKRANKFF